MRLLLRALVPLARASIQTVRHGSIGSRISVHAVWEVREELLLVLNVNIQVQRLVHAGADVLRVHERSPLNGLHLQLNGLLHARQLGFLHE